MRIYDTTTENAIESTHRTTTTNSDAVFACPECGQFKLELTPLKQHWTQTHADELGEFPGPNTTELRTEP